MCCITSNIASITGWIRRPSRPGPVMNFELDLAEPEPCSATAGHGHDVIVDLAQGCTSAPYGEAPPGGLKKDNTFEGGSTHQAAQDRVRLGGDPSAVTEP